MVKKAISLNLTVKGRRAFDVIRVGVFNASNGRLDVGGIPVGYDDTVADYALVLESIKGGKPTAEEWKWARAFAEGVACAFSAI